MTIEYEPWNVKPYALYEDYVFVRAFDTCAQAEAYRDKLMK